MILSKKFECTVDDLDSVIVAVAKEIENGYHVSKIDTYGFTMSCSIKKTSQIFQLNLLERIDIKYELSRRNHSTH